MRVVIPLIALMEFGALIGIAGMVIAVSVTGVYHLRDNSLRDDTRSWSDAEAGECMDSDFPDTGDELVPDDYLQAKSCYNL